jgi:hypothetical protein
MLQEQALTLSHAPSFWQVKALINFAYVLKAQKQRASAQVGRPAGPAAEASLRHLCQLAGHAPHNPQPEASAAHLYTWLPLVPGRSMLCPPLHSLPHHRHAYASRRLPPAGGV